MILSIGKAREAFVNTGIGGDDMSPKELLYIEDALDHEKHLEKKCAETSQQLQNTELKNFTEQLAAKHREIFGKLYQLV